MGCYDRNKKFAYGKDDIASFFHDTFHNTASDAKEHYELPEVEAAKELSIWCIGAMKDCGMTDGEIIKFVSGISEGWKTDAELNAIAQVDKVESLLKHTEGIKRELN